jgi:hypothetical protein
VRKAFEDRSRGNVLGDEEANLFRFARVHQTATLVTGASDYGAAAERLKKILDPWGVRCTIVNAASVNKSRALTGEQVKTWVGLNHTAGGTIKPGDQNPPSLVVKLQLDWGFSFSPDQVIEHYRRIAERSPLPLFACTLGASGVTADLLRRIIEIPQFIGMKNDTDDFDGQERYLATVRQYCDPAEFQVITGGGLSSVALTYDMGVKTYGDTTPWYSPALSLRLYEAFQRRDRALVDRFLMEIEEPLFFQHWPGIGPGGHWGWGHAIAYHLGLFQSPKMRFPSLTLTPVQVAEAKTFLDTIAEWK